MRLERVQAVGRVDHDMPTVGEHPQRVADDRAIVPHMLDDLVEDQDVERRVGEREVLALRGDQVREAGLGQALGRDVEAVHAGAEVAEPAHVGADPAPHVEDPPAFERDVSPDQLEPPLLS